MSVICLLSYSTRVKGQKFNRVTIPEVFHWTVPYFTCNFTGCDFVPLNKILWFYCINTRMRTENETSLFLWVFWVHYFQNLIFLVQFGLLPTTISSVLLLTFGFVTAVCSGFIYSCPFRISPFFHEARREILAFLADNNLFRQFKPCEKRRYQ